MQYQFEKCLWIIRRELRPDRLLAATDPATVILQSRKEIENIVKIVKENLYEIMIDGAAHCNAIVQLHQSDITTAMNLLYDYTVALKEGAPRLEFRKLIKLLGTLLTQLSRWFNKDFRWSHSIPKIYALEKTADIKNLMVEIEDQLTGTTVPIALKAMVVYPLGEFCSMKKPPDYYRWVYLQAYSKEVKLLLAKSPHVNETAIVFLLLEQNMNEDLVVDYYLENVVVQESGDEDRVKYCALLKSRISALQEIPKHSGVAYHRWRPSLLTRIVKRLKELLKEVDKLNEQERQFTLFADEASKISTRLSIGQFSLALWLVNEIKIFPELQQRQVFLAGERLFKCGDKSLKYDSIKTQGFSPDRTSVDFIKNELMTMIRLVNKRGNA